jgi:hypothetical protein
LTACNKDCASAQKKKVDSEKKNQKKKSEEKLLTEGRGERLVNRLSGRVRTGD